MLELYVVLGRHFNAWNVFERKTAYPMVDIRMRLSDRSMKIARKSLDVIFFLALSSDPP